MKKENNILMQTAIFLLWALSTVLSAWTIIAARQSFLISLANLYVKDDIVRGWQARFFDKVFFIIAGLILLITIFLVDGYLRDSLTRRASSNVSLWQRAAKVFGIELLILFVFELITVIVRGSIGSPTGLVLLVGEGVLGGGLLAFSIISKRKT